LVSGSCSNFQEVAAEKGQGDSPWPFFMEYNQTFYEIATIPGLKQKLRSSELTVSSVRILSNLFKNTKSFPSIFLILTSPSLTRQEKLCLI
jgi:hypothetical protein